MLHVLVESSAGKILTKSMARKWDVSWHNYSWSNAPTANLKSAISKFNALSAKIQSKVDVGVLILSDKRYTASDLVMAKAKEDREKLEKKLTSEKLAHTRKIDKIRKDLEKLDKTLS